MSFFLCLKLLKSLVHVNNDNVGVRDDRKCVYISSKKNKREETQTKLLSIECSLEKRREGQKEENIKEDKMKRKIARN